MSRNLILSLMTVIVSILFLMPIVVNDNIDPITVNAEESQVVKNNELDSSIIIATTKAFIDTLVQNTDEDYQVTNFDTKRELERAFDEFAKTKAVQPFIDYYYTERDGSLYIRPTELPPWFKEENNYELDYINEGRAKVEQSNETELYGSYTITLDYVREDGNWLIGNVQYQ